MPPFSTYAKGEVAAESRRRRARVCHGARADRGLFQDREIFAPAGEFRRSELCMSLLLPDCETKSADADGRIWQTTRSDERVRRRQGRARRHSSVRVPSCPSRGAFGAPATLAVTRLEIRFI